MMDLATKVCVACEGGTPPLIGPALAPYLKEVPLWAIGEDKKSIRRDFRFPDFKGAMAFTNRVAELAEREGHHPDIHVWYNKVTLELSTHAIRGLSENDFILGVKVDKFINS